MSTESFKKRVTEGTPSREAYISAWKELVESSFLDQGTKNKLLDVIRSAEEIIGKPNRGVDMDKIGERLITIGFAYKYSHSKEENEEMNTLIEDMSVSIAQAHRILLSK